MNDPTAASTLKLQTTAATIRLSYKFQRLREKIRQAIVNGELTGKLPGERELARRFDANAKTLSKALTDLAAEGLLDRSIGRGTYIRGSRPAAAEEDRWLVLASADTAQSDLVRRLVGANTETQVVTNDVSALRPSFVSSFGAVIDLAPETPETFIRDMIVRGIPVVTVGREARSYSTHVVSIDHVAALSHLARLLALRGHRRFATVERQGSAMLSTTLRAVARRYAGDVTVDACFCDDAATMVENGATAIVCDSPRSAQQAAAILKRQGISIPTHVSLAAIGCDASSYCQCSGYYINVEQEAKAIEHLLHERPARPVLFWISPQPFDAGTIGDACNATTAPPNFSIPLLASA